jgi:hypothetical protein
MEGYGFYFSDMPYKSIEYGGNMKIVKKDDFNFLNSKALITLDQFNDLFNLERCRLKEWQNNSRNNKDWDYYESEINKLDNLLESFGGKKMYKYIEMAFKMYKAENVGQLEYYIPNPAFSIPNLAKIYIYWGFDGYETDGIYTIFNFDKLNQCVESIDIDDYFLKEDIDVKSFIPQKKLNPYLWKNDKLDSRIRLRLLDIADDFTDFLNVDWVKPEDITMTGSLANYNWSEQYSDIDLHIIIDYKKVDERIDFVKEYFKNKKELWNQKHSHLTIYGFPIEVYVQDKNEEHASSGVYSLEKNEWIVKPQKITLDKGVLNKAEEEAEKWEQKINKLVNSYKLNSTDSHKEKTIDTIEKTFDDIVKKRRNSLSIAGDEMNKDNLVFKMLRRNGSIEKLTDKKTEIYNDLMSIR